MGGGTVTFLWHYCVPLLTSNSFLCDLCTRLMYHCTWYIALNFHCKVVYLSHFVKPGKCSCTRQSSWNIQEEDNREEESAIFAKWCDPLVCTQCDVVIPGVALFPCTYMCIWVFLLTTHNHACNKFAMWYVVNMAPIKACQQSSL